MNDEMIGKHFTETLNKVELEIADIDINSILLIFATHVQNKLCHSFIYYTVNEEYATLLYRTMVVYDKI